MRRATAEEGGFTIIEVLVAAFVLVLGALAVFGVLAAATVNTQRAKATQVALNRAQQEMEVLRSRSNEELALTTTPPHSSDERSPDYRVNAGNGTFALLRSPTPSGYEHLVVNGGSLYGGGTISGGTVSPGPESFSSGDVKGKIYRYIAWRNDPNCSEETCPGEQDYKQIVVAVKLEQAGNEAAERGYVEVQSDFIDPSHSAADNPIPGAEGVVTAQQFFLSDTPCASEGETVRQEIAGNHVLHNTLGTCASGLQTGSTLGAPDALLTGSPPDPAPEDPNNPPVYDYSSDYSGTPTPATAKGIQIRADSTSGCHYKPTGTTAPQWQVHRWVTDPVPKKFVMTSNEAITSVTLDFYTRALSDQLYPGELCVYLFDRHETGSPPVATDTMLNNSKGGAPYWTYVPPQGNGYWWRNGWAEVPLTLKFNGPVTVEKGDRLGVALSVERAGTSGSGEAEAIGILYDHPNYRTRIEVDTTTPLEGG